MKYFLALLLIVLFSCRKANHSADAKKINLPLVEQIETLDPANSYDMISARVLYSICEQPYQYHYLKRPFVLEPLLATKMPELSTDQKTFTINLQKDVLYHDDPAFNGKPRTVKADDLKTQIKRIAFTGTRSNGWFLFKNRIVGLDDFRKKAKKIEDIETIKVKGLKVLNEHTLQIKLTQPYPQLKYVMAMSFMTPTPIEFVKYYQNSLSENPACTGPYKLKEWNRGHNVKITRNKNYREAFYPSQGDRFANANGLLNDAGKKIPFVDDIEFKILKENQTQWLNFLNKNIDYLPVPKDNFGAAINVTGGLSDDLLKKGIKLQLMPTLIYWWVGFNMNHPILGKNKNFRMAMAHAIDIKKYIALFTNNVGQKANSIFTPGIPGYDPTSKVNFEYNIEKAKNYLAKAGYPEGKGLPEFTYDVRGSSTFSRQMGEFIAQSFSNIGVKVNVVVNTFPGFLKKLREGRLQIWLDGWGLDYPDAENISQLLYSRSHPPGPNHSYYTRKEVDALIEKLKILPDGDEKFELMKKIQNYVFEDMPWILLYYKRSYVLYQGQLQNFRKSEMIHNYVKYLRKTP